MMARSATMASAAIEMIGKTMLSQYFRVRS